MVKSKSRDREVYSAGGNGANVYFYYRGAKKCDEQSNPPPTAFFVIWLFLWLTLGWDPFPLLLLGPAPGRAVPLLGPGLQKQSLF